MSAHASAAAVHLEGVSAGYGATIAVNRVDLQVNAGEFLALVGPNGGGKSTVLKLVLGLLTPIEGTIRVDGQPPVRSRHRIGYLPQTEHIDLSFPVPVRDVVGMGRLRPSWRPQPLRTRDRAAIDTVLARVGMTCLAGRPIGALSAGQRQRVLLARALVDGPELLLLDEPEAGLDPDSVARLYELLASLTGRTTILMASHDVGTVGTHATRVAVVDHGVTLSAGSADGASPRLPSPSRGGPRPYAARDHFRVQP